MRGVFTYHAVWSLELLSLYNNGFIKPIACSFLMVSIVAEPRNIHAHKAYVVGKPSALGEQSDLAKEFGKHFSRWQSDAFAHRSNQALATVDFIVVCFHFEQTIGKQHDKIVHRHRTLAVPVSGFIKQAKCRYAAAAGAYRLKLA